MTASDIEHVAERAVPLAAQADREGVEYLGSLLFSDDDLVLCLFEGPTRAAVRHASQRAGIPCERLMDTTWLKPDQHTVKGAKA